MSEEPKVEGRSITEELGKLGKQMADAIKAAWESEDRRKLQAEILDGLQKFGDEVTVAFDKAGQSDTAKDLRVKAEKVVVDVRASAVAEDVRKGIISGLDVLNAEMSKLVEKLEPKPAPSDEAPVEPEAPAEPTEPEAPVEPEV
jgi:predicted GNAT superfamily acetyltransferase